VTINDIDHVYEILCNWPETDVKVLTVAAHSIQSARSMFSRQTLGETVKSELP